MRVIITIICYLASGAGVAADAERGAQLYENHCTGCHSSVAHQRETRKAGSFEALLIWVERWRRNLDLDWSTDDVEDVTASLDERFYRFRAVSGR